MIKTGKEAEKAAALHVADIMATAAKTAPKGHGLDDIMAVVLDGEEKGQLADEMRRLSEELNTEFFLRDARGVERAHCIVLIAARKKNTALMDICGHCGFGNCTACAEAGGKCSIVTTDLGIAIGSAVSIAADNRIDNRIMFSAGKAAMNLDFFDKKIMLCYGIPLFASSKNKFFERA